MLNIKGEKTFFPVYCHWRTAVSLQTDRSLIIVNTYVSHSDAYTCVALEVSIIKREMTCMNSSRSDLKTSYSKNRFCRYIDFLHSWVSWIFVFSVSMQGESAACSHLLLLFCLLPVRRKAVTRWLNPKKRIQIEPLESCATGLSTWQRTKWQALSHSVSIDIFCHLFLSILFSKLYSVLESKMLNFNFCS